MAQGRAPLPLVPPLSAAAPAPGPVYSPGDQIPTKDITANLARHTVASTEFTHSSSMQQVYLHVCRWNGMYEGTPFAKSNIHVCPPEQETEGKSHLCRSQDVLNSSLCKDLRVCTKCTAAYRQGIQVRGCCMHAPMHSCQPLQYSLDAVARCECQMRVLIQTTELLLQILSPAVISESLKAL